MSEEEVKLDRYAKFRALGQFEEFLVPGGQWRETRASRAKASSCWLLVTVWFCAQILLQSVLVACTWVSIET